MIVRSSAVPATTLLVDAADSERLAAAAAVADAVNVRGPPVSPAEVAVRVLLLPPAVVPRIQEPTVATPDAFVVCELPVTEPPPVAAANVTETPATGLPN